MVCSLFTVLKADIKQLNFEHERELMGVISSHRLIVAFEKHGDTR